MTTKANKFGLRKAAEERTNRHAQRTPLPPRAGAIEDAKEVLQMVATATETNRRSEAKAEAFSALCVQYGWTTETETRGEAVEVTAKRGPEAIVQSWLNGVWQYEASVYAFSDRTTKPRNASGAKRLLERAADAAAAEMAKVAANNSFRKRTPTDLAPVALPLDPELLTDEEAAKFFRGQTVRWFNRLSRSTETAMVSRSAKVYVTRWDGETTVCFCCPVTGFRAFHLSAVLAVGRGRKASETEAAAVVLETADAA